MESYGNPRNEILLVSREVIADSIETVVGAEGMDGVVTIGGCDKNMPACLIALARLNRPGVFVYGGTILPGIHKDKNLDIVSVFEAVGSHASGAIDHEELVQIEKKAIPGPGSCGGMYTANTMSSAIEALGMSLPDSSAQLAVSEDKRKDAQEAGTAVLNLIEQDIKPRDIMTRKAFENAITVVITLGGSTNAVLHLLAMAHAAEVHLELNDFTEIGKRVPVLCDLKPSGKYNMSHFVRIGGLRPLLKTLLDEGLLHGDCMTVTGKTLSESVEGAQPYAPYPDGQDLVSHSTIRSSRTVTCVFCMETSPRKVRWRKSPVRKGSASPAKLSYTSRRKLPERNSRWGSPGWSGRRDSKRGPVGGLGCGNAFSHFRHYGKRLRQGSRLDHGWSILRWQSWLRRRTRTPEAAIGGPLGLLQNGDPITIDAEKNELTLDLPEEEIKKRRDDWIRPEPKEKRGVLAKYAKLVSSASQGAITDEF